MLKTLSLRSAFNKRRNLIGFMQQLSECSSIFIVRYYGNTRVIFPADTNGDAKYTVA